MRDARALADNGAMASGQRGSGCSYELDRRLTIVRVGPGWDEFALENGTAELVSPSPIGRPLMMYFADATTVHLYELMFQRVTNLGRHTTVPIRCDGPDIRRYLNLTISVTSTGGYHISTTMVRWEPRPPVLLLAADAARGEESLTLCSFCHRVDVTGRWIEVEEAVSLLRLFERRRQPRLEQSVCHACHKFMNAMLADEPTRPSNS